MLTAKEVCRPRALIAANAPARLHAILPASMRLLTHVVLQLLTSAVFLSTSSFSKEVPCRLRGSHCSPVRHLVDPVDHIVHGSSATVEAWAPAEDTSPVWTRIQHAIDQCGSLDITLPGERTQKTDWVTDGRSLSESQVHFIQEHISTFLNRAPKYPEHSPPAGQGIVIMGGMAKYFVPAWVSVNLMRSVGSKLPVEMFFPAGEFPPAGVVAGLSALQVTCRQLPTLADADPSSGLRALLPDKQSRTARHLRGYRFKVASIICSSFDQVLFLDADSSPVQPPEILFASPEFAQYGAMLWPDFWQSSIAPQLVDILGLDPDSPSMHNRSYESGQMMWDKRRTWEALMLSTYLNIHSKVFYPLLSEWMGMGDKNSFAIALESRHMPYHFEAHPVENASQYDSPGNAMVQHFRGSIFFVHNQLKKWTAHIPEEFGASRRRWEVYGRQNESFETALADVVGLDVEYECYLSLRKLRCAPWYHELHADWRVHVIHIVVHSWFTTADFPC